MIAMAPSALPVNLCAEVALLLVHLFEYTNRARGFLLLESTLRGGDGSLLDSVHIPCILHDLLARRGLSRPLKP